MNWASWSAASVFANSLLSVSGSSPAAPMIRCPGRVHVCRPPGCVWATLAQAASITAHATTTATNLDMQDLGFDECGSDRVVERLRAVAHEIVARQTGLGARPLDLRARILVAAIAGVERDPDDAR